jgi:hypothetical protein
MFVRDWISLITYAPIFGANGDRYAPGESIVPRQPEDTFDTNLPIITRKRFDSYKYGIAKI